MKKILLLGSAPYMPKWIEKHHDVLNQFTVYAMNNAWALCPELIHTWLHSTDFHSLEYTLKPTGKQRSKWRGLTHYLTEPYWYDKQSNGTMILNVLSHILNEFVQEKECGQVFVAGCDLNYLKGISFYKGGQADPMRFGELYLAHELDKLEKAYHDKGIGIFNAGNKQKTMLPFIRWGF